MCPIENGRPERKKNNRWVWVCGKKLTKEEEQKEFEEKTKKIQTPRSAERIPDGGRHCMSCDGRSGRSSLDRRKKCEICRGNGYWTREDIELYHKDCTIDSCFGGIYSCGVAWDKAEREKLKPMEGG